MKNVFYMHKLSSIGGVESFLYYLAKKYHNFIVYYTEADEKQVKRLAQYVEVRKYTKPIKCDRFFCNYKYDIEVEAKEKYHIIHYDPLNVGFGTFYDKDFKYIGVSKVACDGFKEITGQDIELIYNPVEIEKVKTKKLEGLNLISCTRLTSEKGQWRINELANRLDREEIKFHWRLFTNKKRAFDSKNIEVLPQKLDVRKEVAESSFLVQLSDCESYGLSVAESLILGTPVIVTDLKAFREIGVNDKNGIIIDLNMKNIPIEEIVKGKEKFDYKIPKETWNKYLTDEIEYNPNELQKVRVLKRVYLVEENIHAKRNNILDLKKSRVSELEAQGLVEIYE